jgi:hypothetical protein
MICFVPTTAYSNLSNRWHLYASTGSSSTALCDIFSERVIGVGRDVIASFSIGTHGIISK